MYEVTDKILYYYDVLQMLYIAVSRAYNRLTVSSILTSIEVRKQNIYEDMHGLVHDTVSQRMMGNVSYMRGKAMTIP